MPVDKFRFVSPGIFLNEIDQSQIPALPENVGPVIVGRTEKGPGMIPTKVRSFSEFVEIFGNPIAGLGGVTDVWREGNYSSPTYGAYAAQAYLRSGVGPVTFIRLLGAEHPDANAAGKAGWETTNAPDTTSTSNGGPFGLFLFPSGAAGSTYAGTLAAVWYMDSGSVPVLSGTSPAGNQIEGVATLVKSDASGQFKVRLIEGASTELANVTFSLNESSDNFIRKVFNTNPQTVNTAIEPSTSTASYWLGETFERHLTVESLVPSSNDYYGVILPVVNSSDAGAHDKRMQYRDAQTGWFFGQNFDAATGSYSYDSMTKLFKFVGINGYGSWLQENVKISIDNIRASANENVPYGTFDVVVRRANDSDLRPVVLERFSNCNLNKNSPNFIAAKIGDMALEWDSAEKRYNQLGDFPNVSRYIRVHMNAGNDGGYPNTEILPFGVYGPPRYPTATFASSSAAISPVTAYIQGSGNVPTDHFVDGGKFVNADNTNFGTASITFPAVGIRTIASTQASGSSDGADPTTNAYFGLQTGKNANSNVTDPGYMDYLRPFGVDTIGDGTWVDDFALGSLPSPLEHQWTFTLDEVIIGSGSSFTDAAPTNNILSASWSSGSYVAGTSWNAGGSGGSTLTSARYKNILDSKVNRFTTPMYGGFDGLDITERDPFRNSLITENPTEQDSYVYYTLRRAIDTVADPEVAEMNLLSIPGITDDRVTDHILNTAESRGDTLAVIDVEGGFAPRHEENATRSARKGDLNQVLSDMKARNLNNSYGAAYYPWVKVRDTVNGVLLDVPPSVVALGVLASTERSADVWFAPAGFNRGGLSNGAGGLPVVGVETKLTSRNRDDLYDVNINPIASFPAEGIVVFGQKTLQATPSALDRINVRRLMIFVKRGISRISATTLFQPNVQATWDDFKSRSERFLNDVKVRFGIDDFRVVLDSSTTTPDLVDRNILYAKIFIKPTRAIEFIAIDFIITRSGASFDD